MSARLPIVDDESDVAEHRIEDRREIAGRYSMRTAMAQAVHEDRSGAGGP